MSVGLLAMPGAVAAQGASKSPRVGFLVAAGGDRLFEAFRQGLGELGWTEGRNIVLDYQAAGSRTAVRQVAVELVNRSPNVILLSAAAIYEARTVIGRIPTVFVVAEDPVRAGFVESLARPGGHMTGLTSLNVELDGKRLEMLRMAMSGVSRVGVLATTEDPTARERVAAAEQAGRVLGLDLHIFELPTPDRFTTAFEALRRERLEALMLIGSPPFFPYQRQIAQLAAKTGVPVISAWREFPDAGGLMSYGTSVRAMFRKAASYVDRILKGANPGELPVERASTFELVINLKAAKDLGVTIPPSLMLRADHVIQ